MLRELVAAAVDTVGVAVDTAVVGGAVAVAVAAAVDMAIINPTVPRHSAKTRHDNSKQDKQSRESSRLFFVFSVRSAE